MARALLILTVLALSSFSSHSYAEVGQHILGLSAPLSGGGAGWGNDVRNVLLFANEKLAGGRYSLLAEDDKCDPKTSLSVARKFGSVDKIKEVFVVCGQAALATAKTYRAHGIFVIAPLATPSRISQLGVLRTSMSDEVAAGMLAKTIVSHFGSIAVLTEENDYPVSFLQDFQKTAESLGLAVVNQTYLAEQQDFRSQLTRMKVSKVPALFLNTQTEQALANILRQLREIGFSPALYGAYLPGSSGFLKIGAHVAEGIVFVDFPGAEELLTEEGRRLYKEYQERYGPIQGWSFTFPATFEAFRVVHLALSSGQPIEQYPRNTSFNGVMGPYSFDSHGDIIGPKHVMRRIKGGKSVRYVEAAAPN